jgi:hypothetical protein
MGCATFKNAGDGEVSITLPAVLGQIVLAALFHDPARRPRFVRHRPPPKPRGGQTDEPDC